MQCSAVLYGFFYHKTALLTTKCGAVHYHLLCGYFILRVFWSVWVQSCDLSYLMNTPTCRRK